MAQDPRELPEIACPNCQATTTVHVLEHAAFRSPDVWHLWCDGCGHGWEILKLPALASHNRVNSRPL